MTRLESGVGLFADFAKLHPCTPGSLAAACRAMKLSLPAKGNSFQFEVLEAKDGLTGLETAKQHHPDLILPDFVMPKVDGYGTLQALRPPALQSIGSCPLDRPFPRPSKNADTGSECAELFGWLQRWRRLESTLAWSLSTGTV